MIIFNPFDSSLIDIPIPSSGITQNGTVDPSAGAGVNAALGTIYVDTANGTIWIKTGPGPTNWTNVTGTGASTAGYHVEKITLDIVAITSKYIDLSQPPTTPNLTRLVVIDGIEQDYTTDFIMTANEGNRRLTWNGLGLDGVLAVGDRIIVIYN
jgi:hypothetical protein